MKLTRQNLERDIILTISNYDKEVEDGQLVLGVQRCIILTGLMLSVYAVYMQAQTTFTYWIAIYTGLFSYLHYLMMIKQLLRGDGLKTVQYAVVPGIFAGAGMIMLMMMDTDNWIPYKESLIIASALSFGISFSLVAYNYTLRTKKINELKYKLI